MKRLDRWKRRAAQLKHEVQALALACKDPRTPLHAKLLAVGIVAYALSPIDLIPDFIPVLGYLDDLILVPAGIYLVVKMIPEEVMNECRARARLAAVGGKSNWVAAAIILVIWIGLAAWVVTWSLRFF